MSAPHPATPTIRPPTLASLNVDDAERALVETALSVTTTLVDAAQLLGLSRHALKRRIAKHGLQRVQAAR